MMAMPRTTDMREPMGKVMYDYFDQLVSQFVKAGKRCHSPYTDFYRISPKERRIILGILKEEDDEVQKLLEQVQETKRKKR